MRGKTRTAAALALLDNGMTVSEAAKECGLSTASVYSALERVAKSGSTCPLCADYAQDRMCATRGACLRSRMEDEHGRAIYREVTSGTRTGMKAWCPYRKGGTR